MNFVEIKRCKNNFNMVCSRVHTDSYNNACVYYTNVKIDIKNTVQRLFTTDT